MSRTAEELEVLRELRRSADRKEELAEAYRRRAEAYRKQAMQIRVTATVIEKRLQRTAEVSTN